MPLGVVTEPPSESGYDERWAGITRAVRTALLARPTARQMTPYPNPYLLREIPLTISQAALVYKPSKRVKLLGKHLPRVYTPKYTKPPKQEHYVHPEALVFVPSPRILEIAFKQKKTYLGKKKLSRRKELKRLKRAKKLREQRSEWLALRAGPKKPQKPPALPKTRFGKKKVKISPEEVAVRIEKLAKARPQPPSNIRYGYEITKAAMRYKATDRIREISSPKELMEEAFLDLTYDPYKIKKAALQYKPSPRMKELSVPNVRKQAVDTDVKENPFSVLPRALTAICSKRTKELAKPVVRD